ncbi:MAG: nuclear transport factor 2 family protein [Sphingopyxis sp.]|uniref:nuclear transport factor 2 family protein n=1 Tax=Sphingopyxis sp. TaxID=1908224 RepID=UPI002AB8B739|nr:nuclear transport factor 2 family protein [Sphingopyxis sp.]MDZ3832023.1 nuclear transport factor 2 family protein [Sphingopyxis sp.]
MSGHRGLAAWHAYIAGNGDAEALRAMIAADAVFHSPVVHTPQEGSEKVFAYLYAASHALGGDDFRYLREISEGNQACLEFQTQLDGIHINGVDLIRWNDAGQIVDFKVMIRPLKAVNKVWEKMAATLSAQAG